MAFAGVEDSIKTAAAKPRLFDVYILGPMLILASLQAKKPLGKWTRRALFTAGVYGIIRNLDAYQALIALPNESPPKDGT